ncbi:MAG TPA: DUF4230 domain-containing protein [Polyangiaceae bacterium]|jgi:hypothetical protein
MAAELDPASRQPAQRNLVVALVVALVGCVALLAGLVGYLVADRTSPEESRTVVRPTNTILMAVRDLARLETGELHMEKVVDLTEKQNRFFGLVDTSDAILLIAAGDVTVGIDLTKLGDDDFSVDAQTGAARLTLPEPEILSVRLDEEHTYVYRRSVGMLAHRNEQLEVTARREAVRMIGDAARDAMVMDKARTQAEREVRGLLQRFGVTRVNVGWHPT